MRTINSLLVLCTTFFLSQSVSAQVSGKNEGQLSSVTYQDPERVVLHVKEIDVSRNFVFCVGGVRFIWDRMYCSSVSPAGEADIVMDAERPGGQTFVLVPATLRKNKDTPLATYPENTRLPTKCGGSEYPDEVSILILRPADKYAITPASAEEVQSFKKARERKLCRKR